MIIHNVYFWLKEGISENQKQDFEQGMRTLAAAVPEVKQAIIGVPAATPSREVTDHSFGYSLFLWFDSIEEHNIYQDHPAHHVFIENFKELWTSVKVSDSDIK